MGLGERVLVTDLVNGRSRSAVAAVRALAGGGYAPIVTVSGRRSPAAASRDCAGVVRVPPCLNGDYADAVRREMADRDYVAVMPASDGALLALGLPGADLVDKSTLPARAAAAGLRTPRTLRLDGPEELAAAAGRLEYPLVVKPVVKSGPGSLARRVDTPAALVALAAESGGASVVQPFLDGDLRAVAGVVHEGRLLALVHQGYVRTWPADCGVASAAVTTAPDTGLEQLLARLLSAHSGVFQVQLIGSCVIDVNPRVYGSLPLAVAAGANLPAIFCAAVQGRGQDLVRARPGVRYRWAEGDVRRLGYGLRRGELGLVEAVRALYPRLGTAHSVESLRDPGPVLTRVANVVTRRPV